MQDNIFERKKAHTDKNYTWAETEYITQRIGF